MSEQAMVLVQAEGWDVYQEGPGHWVRDVYLGEQAGLAKPTNIRKVIAKAIEEGAIMARGACDDKEPQYREVTEEVTAGKGAKRAVPAYYLNREAAMLILGRLRTDAAERTLIAAQAGLVRAFDALEGVSRAALALPAKADDNLLTLAFHLAERVAALEERLAGAEQRLLLRGKPTLEQATQDAICDWIRARNEATWEEAPTSGPTAPSRETVEMMGHFEKGATGPAIEALIALGRARELPGGGIWASATAPVKSSPSLGYGPRGAR